MITETRILAFMELVQAKLKISDADVEQRASQIATESIERTEASIREWMGEKAQGRTDKPEGQ